MRTLTQYIEERLIINKNFNCKELFKPTNAKELQDYINSRVDELIKNDDNILDMSNVDLSSLKPNSSNDKPLYKIFSDPLQKVRKMITVDVSDWDVTGYKRIDCIFFGCSCIETIKGLDTWDVSNAKDFAGFFSQCNNLKDIDVSGWQLNNAYTLMAMFYGCRSLIKINGIDTWDFGDNKNINMENMFYNCQKLNNIGDIEYWEDAAGCTDEMFYSCYNLTLPNWYKKSK